MTVISADVNVLGVEDLVIPNSSVEDVAVGLSLFRDLVLDVLKVTVVDPRRAFATEERFPSVALLSDWPDDALAELAPDGRTAVVTLTHDPKIDDPALHMALRSPAFYIGSLGSKKTHAARLKRLAMEGFNETEVARISGPVGLAIGARSPAEIAIAILAQITQQLHQSSPPVEAVGAAA